MDERTSPTAQPGKDWATCLPCHSDSTAWFHHPARFFYKYPIKLSQKSWWNIWRTADLQRPHCKDCSILPVCITQHQKDQALSNGACNTTSCPGPCHFLAGLLQCSSGWTSIKHNQTSSTSQKKKACYTSLYLLHWLPVAAHFKFKTLMLAYGTTTGSAPAYFHSLMTIYIPSISLRSTSEQRLVVPSQRGTKSLSRTFSFTTPSSDNWKLISFDTIWLHPKFKANSKTCIHELKPDVRFDHSQRSRPYW